MSLIDEARKEVENILKELNPEIFKYHNLDHTLEVVQAAEEILSKTDFTEEEKEIVLVAAWFHDAGYSINYFNHEESSKKLAREFLLKQGWENEKIRKVEDCIEATCFPQKPKDKLAEVLCDADMSHLRDSDYLEKSENLRQELSIINKITIKKSFFCKKTLAFMNDQHFFTEYAKKNFEPGKKKNWLEMQEKVKDKRDKNKILIDKQRDKIEKLEERLSKKSSPERGIESMFRMTARNQINLSSIADNKANILITVNSIIISVLATFVQRIVAENSEMLIPMLIILSTSLLTIIFAILSTRPKLSTGRFTREDIEQKRVNLMFFGNFYDMNYEEYEWAVKEMMKDYEGLYSNMIKDQFSLGVVLAVKYNRIRIAYNIFMFGLITFVLSIIVVQLINV